MEWQINTEVTGLHFGAGLCGLRFEFCHLLTGGIEQVTECLSPVWPRGLDNTHNSSCWGSCEDDKSGYKAPRTEFAHHKDYVHVYPYLYYHKVKIVQRSTQ